MTRTLWVLLSLVAAMTLWTCWAWAEQPGDIEGLYNKARQLEKSGNIQGALQGYSAVLRVQPRHYDALLACGRLSYNSGEYRKAIRYFKDLIAFYPKDLTGRIYLGDSLLEAGFAQRAKTVFRKLVADDPNDVKALIGMAKAEYSTGNRFAAVETLKKASVLDPSNETVAILMARFKSANRDYIERSEYERGMKQKSALNNSIAESAARARAEALKARSSTTSETALDRMRRGIVFGAAGEEEGSSGGRRGSGTVRGRSGKTRYDQRY